MTPNLTDLPPDIQEKRTSRIYIGDVFRYDKRYFPAITVRHASAKYYPISFNQNFFNTKYRMDLVIDGYGERSYVRTPTYHTIVGAWEQTFDIQIATEAIPDREELSDLVSAFMIGVARQELGESGLGIKSVSISGEREEEYANDKIYLQTISVETFSEWKREIPIDSIMEMVNFCFNYGLFSSNGPFVTDSTYINISDSVPANP
jgi:ssDNA-specific exonuclease RecJ